MPFRWKTVPERLDEAGILWQIYQDNNSYIDNPPVFWEQYQNIPKDSSQSKNALRFLGQEHFLEDAHNRDLPEVSYVIAHHFLTEHPPFTIDDGAWVQRQVANVIMHGKDLESTVLIISYDETGGWVDHLMAPHAPKGTHREWITDPRPKDGMSFSKRTTKHSPRRATSSVLRMLMQESIVCDPLAR